jgi:hypothetical protein
MLGTLMQLAPVLGSCIVRRMPVVSAHPELPVVVRCALAEIGMYIGTAPPQLSV